MTLNALIKTITDIGTAHKQIKTVYYGNAFDFLSKGSDNVYPAMFFDLNGGSINNLTSSVDFTFFFADRVLPDQANEQEVQSDQLSVLYDIYAQFNDNGFEFTVQEDVTINFFVEDTPDYLAGVSATISFDLPYLKDRCQVPSDYNYQ
jgi:hypothetical protein